MGCGKVEILNYVIHIVEILNKTKTKTKTKTKRGKTKTNKNKSKKIN